MIVDLPPVRQRVRIRTGALVGAILRDPPLMARLIRLGGAQGAARRTLIPALEQLVIEFG